MSPRAIAWFRNDLRITDNILLHEIKEFKSRGASILCVYCFDPRHFQITPFGSPKCSSYRSKFLLESVENLRTNLRSIQSDLWVSIGQPERLIPEFVTAGSSDIVLVQSESAYEEARVEKLVEKRLRAMGSSLRRLHSDASLYHLEDLPFGSMNEIPDIFTPFKEKVERRSTIRPMLPTLHPGDLGFPPNDLPANLSQNFEYLPSVVDLLGHVAISTGVDENGNQIEGVMKFQGGEDAGKRRIQEWMWRDDNLKDYFEIRNGMLGEKYSSKLSPWLAHGCISPRFVVSEVKRYESQRTANKSTYWLIFELIWRDFFRLICAKYGSNIFQPGGALGLRKQWVTNDIALERWKNGTTGVPLVDANMRELKNTGWMSNRGRQNVASYLVLELGLDWRLGADHFESLLLDHDVYSNYGNWNAAAGLLGGRLNQFNMAKQSRDYDPAGNYIRYWIPELKAVPVPRVFEPWLMSQSDQMRYTVKIENTGLPKTYPLPLIVSKVASEGERRNSTENTYRGTGSRPSTGFDPSTGRTSAGGRGIPSKASSSRGTDGGANSASSLRRGSKLQH